MAAGRNEDVGGLDIVVYTTHLVQFRQRIDLKTIGEDATIGSERRTNSAICV